MPAPLRVGIGSSLEGWRRPWPQVPALSGLRCLPPTPRLQPLCWGGGLRARLPPSRGCGAASSPDEERGSPFSLFSTPLPPRAPLFSLGKGSGGVSSPGVKTPAPELGVSAQVSASVVTSPPGLGLDKYPTSEACTASAQAFLPRVSRLSFLLPTCVSALTLEYLSLALWDALSPGSRTLPSPIRVWTSS